MDGIRGQSYNRMGVVVSESTTMHDLAGMEFYTTMQFERSW